MTGGRWPQKNMGSAPAVRKPRLPAFGADALAMRRQGMAVSALIVGLDHFNAGRAWTTVRNTLRVVVPADVRDVTAMDWTVAAGLDVVVDHWCEPAEGMSERDARRAASMRGAQLLYALLSAGAQSLWWVSDDERGEAVSRVECYRLVRSDGSFAYSAMSVSAPVDMQSFPSALEDLHDLQLVQGEGVFGTQAAVPARLARLAELFGGDLRMVAMAAGVDVRAAA